MTLLRLLAFEPAGGRRRLARRRVAPRLRSPPRAASRAPTAARRSERRRAPVAAARARRRRQRRRAVRDARGIPLPSGSPRRWPGFVAGLQLTGMARSLRRRPSCSRLDGTALTLALPAAHKHLADRTYADKLKAALEQATGAQLLLAFEVGEPADALARRRGNATRAARRRRAEAAFRDEPFVRDVVARFDAGAPRFDQAG